MAPKKPQASKLEKLQLLEERAKLQANLPHIYGYKFYPWMREFYESKNKMNLICSANQIGKSSCQIRKAVHWATDPGLKKLLWPHLEPRQFWYLYPSSYVATIEVEKKWIPEFLPRGELKKHPLYGWRADYRSKYIQALHFNTGISIYFKTYSQDPQDLQSGTCSAIFTDEELPEELFPELQMRLAATDGYFHAVFTPTLGQEFWREAIELRGPKERFPEALKLNVSMYDCLKYEDGTNSFWTRERIEKIKAGCKSDAEIQRRVYGKFILDSGLKYPGFNPATNIISPHAIPDTWPVYVGVDSGSGGKHNHPSAISFIAMRPDYRLGVVFKGTRFDGYTMTASDLVEIVQRELQQIKNPIHGVFYDYAAADLKEIAARMGQQWIPAEKSHLIGEQIINVGFKNNMLQIFNTPELTPLVIELKSVRLITPKNMAHDDAIDSMRYGITKIPWDWSAIGEKPKIIDDRQESVEELRKNHFNQPDVEDYETIEQEMDYYSDLMLPDYM